ncbi:glycoside hydrolase family 30 beta sandwich domain-containing protein [Flavobacterium sp. LC2016-12]|uniref:glycoside hydrolase family 30 protein n=1 Tax=Flavobacterium sp. LC2016-12 TaxID=2783794 RepID=UPI00188D27AA|nr:glycoside hydrolase family 30 protein [Flavobacterium sp. LC2016-12]MBF4467121.1 glycoside hydrolase family 30 protein [Flavobacterium sp. LC2016-12]
MKTINRILIVPILVLQLSCSSSKNVDDTTVSPSKSNKKIQVYTTAENTNLRLSLSNNLISNSTSQQINSTVSIVIDTEKTDQTFLGIGGAITDASAEVFAKLSPKKQQEFLTAYYDKNKGIGYSLARTNIHSCDFSSDSYTYVSEGDKELKTFNIDHDRKYRIPLIKKAIETAGGKLTLFVSPWSPPAFMKDNNDILHGGVLLPEFAQSWANYYAKFIKAYEKEGVPVWGLTIQNEPMAKQRWESCIYTPEAERDFLKNFLGPTLEKEGLGSKNIIIWDHNRGDMLEKRANLVFSDPEVSKYAWGIGFHWYETWNGGPPQFQSVGNVHKAFPNKNLLFTEGCVEKFDTAKFQFWENAERYGLNMINDFNNGTVGWTDWNILLDQNGGPNHVGNFCFAPIHADTTKDELIFTPMYYYIGHLSKFIQPNAKRINQTISDQSLLSTSFKNSDGKIATIVMNQSDKDVVYSLINNTLKTTITIPPHAIQTIVY